MEYLVAQMFLLILSSNSSLLPLEDRFWMILQRTPQKMLSIHCLCGLVTAVTGTWEVLVPERGTVGKLPINLDLTVDLGELRKLDCFEPRGRNMPDGHGQRITGYVNLNSPLVLSQKEVVGMIETSYITRGNTRILMNRSSLEIESLKIWQEYRTREIRNMSLSTGCNGKPVSYMHILTVILFWRVTLS